MKLGGRVRGLRIEKFAGDSWRWQVLTVAASGDILRAGTGPTLSACLSAIRREAIRSSTRKPKKCRSINGFSSAKNNLKNS